MRRRREFVNTSRAWCAWNLGGSIFMSQGFIDDTGSVISVRRKLKPTHVERSVFGEGDGSDIQVHQTAIGRIGALNCWEHLQPLTKYAMFSMNEQIHVGSWPSFSVYRGAAQALGAEVNDAASLVYAVEGQTFVLAPSAVVGQATCRGRGGHPLRRPRLLDDRHRQVCRGPRRSLLPP